MEKKKEAKEVIEKRLNQLKDERPGHQAFGARALREIAVKSESIQKGDKILEAIPELEKMLVHKNLNLRQVSAGALVSLGLKGHYDLNKLLRHEDLNVVKGAVDSLSRIIKDMELNQ